MSFKIISLFLLKAEPTTFATKLVEITEAAADDGLFGDSIVKTLLLFKNKRSFGVVIGLFEGINGGIEVVLPTQDRNESFTVLVIFCCDKV